MMPSNTNDPYAPSWLFQVLGPVSRIVRSRRCHNGSETQRLAGCPHNSKASTNRPLAVILAAIGWLLTTPLTMAETALSPPPDNPHHRKQGLDCTSCHEGDRATPKPADTPYCQRCHDAPVGPANKRVSAEAGEIADAPLHDEAAGLHGPAYYDETRFGAAPGPMVRIPAGPFVMGSDDRLADEGPAHRVELPDYWIDRYEVTNLQYKAFIDATGHRSPRHFRNRTYPAGKVDHPVTFVSWYDARDYCRWAGKRLPTEQEWEKAARGTDARIYPWGNEFAIERANTPVRWVRLGRQGDTTPIGAFPEGRSPYGLEDMSGNVWEWTSSWYLPHPGNTQPSENYGHIYKVLKGGSWWDCSYYKCGISAPTFNRSFFNARVRNSSFGFRCAADRPPAEPPTSIKEDP